MRSLFFLFFFLKKKEYLYVVCKLKECKLFGFVFLRQAPLLSLPAQLWVLPLLLGFFQVFARDARFVVTLVPLVVSDLGALVGREALDLMIMELHIQTL